MRARGVNQDVPVPYITPSLRDYLEPLSISGTYTPKFVACGGQIGDNGWCQTAKDADFIPTRLGAASSIATSTPPSTTSTISRSFRTCR